MQKLNVLDKNNKILYTGIKADCMQFIKMRKYDRTEISIKPIDDATPVEYETTSFTEPETKPKGLFKRIFS